MRKKNESGIALIAVLLMLLLLGALFETFVISLNSEQRSLRATLSENDTGGRTEYTMRSIARSIADEINAGRLTGDGRITNEMRDDLIRRATARFDSENLGLTIRADITPRSGYGIGKQNTLGASAGTFAGMSAMIIPYIITVTGSTAYGEEIKLEQEVQIVYIPAFQFGMFSESDLSFFAGNLFSFGGRVHTNGDLYLLGNNLELTDRASAAGKIWRHHKPNRPPYYAATNNDGRDNDGLVKIVYGEGANNFKELRLDYGNDGPDYKNDDARWKRDMFDPGTSTSKSFNGFLSNGYTGTKPLRLPLVTSDATPIDIIRRPADDEDSSNPDLFDQRYFSIASVRILLSDEVNDINRLPTIDKDKAPVALEGVYSGTTLTYKFAEDVTQTNGSGTYYTPVGGAPLIGGYIKVEIQDNQSKWHDVTREILNLGVSGLDMTGKCPTTGTSADAVIRLQRFSDRTNTTGCSAITDGTQFWPNVLFDAREAVNDDKNQYPSGMTSSNWKLLAGGIMHYVELDIGNLGKWLKSSDARVYDTGYVIYFSDRRSSPREPDGYFGSKDTPMYGFENSSCNHSSCPGGRADANGNGVADGTLNPGSVSLESPKSVRSIKTYTIKDGSYYVTATTGNTTTVTAATAGTAITPLTASVDKEVAKKIRPLFFRRALKLVNGGKISLGVNTETAVPYGLAVASENPVYIQGNYNAQSKDDVTGGVKYKEDGSVPASVIADAVTVLSNNWKDTNSFSSAYAASGRSPVNTYYRMAIIAGKNKNFIPGPCPDTATCKDFGTDGGAHNFLRYLESWSDSNNLYYYGSIVNLYYSQEAMSTFKSNAGNVYAVPKREYKFDTEFLDFRRLPPRTPMFRDINMLGFARITKASKNGNSGDGGGGSGTIVVITKP